MTVGQALVTAAAVGGLALGLVNAAVQWLTPWWRSRSASFLVTAETRIAPVAADGKVGTQRRIVLMNRGAGRATDVSVRCLDEDGVELAGLTYFGQVADVVYPGQTRHVVYEGRLNTRDLRFVLLGFSDGRGTHEERHSVVSVWV